MGSRDKPGNDGGERPLVLRSRRGLRSRWGFLELFPGALGAFASALCLFLELGGDPVLSLGLALLSLPPLLAHGRLHLRRELREA